MGNAEIDRQILAACEPDWRKVAFVFHTALSALGIGEKKWADQMMTKRLRILMRKGYIEAVGDIWNWRASEIRLAPRRLDGRRVRPT